MNRIVTSKKEILDASRELMKEKGWAAINIRAVAAYCGVSVGSIYNYFNSKSELVSAVVESVWQEIFYHSEDEEIFENVMSCISWIYKRMEYGQKQFPGFFTLHSLGFMSDEKADGKKQMQRTWEHIFNGLCSVLKHDTNIRSDAFDDKFTTEKFADILFSLMMTALVRQDYDPSSALIIAQRILY
ncbi:MAG: TetR/AcrR family transcriptional regulator [Clostridiales bacterium]|nr:TetR/AcrR family transcriptional regulator [Clostridiales bacterium]